MNFLSLEYFVLVTDEGSFSGAARKAYVSQQTISEHIKKLETEMDAKLIERKSPIILTPAGKCFLSGAKTILDTKNKMQNEVRLAQQMKRVFLTLGVATYDLPPALPELISKFSTAYPEYEVTVVKRQAVDVAHNMYNVDLYFTYPPADELLSHVLLYEDTYSVALNTELARSVYNEKWPEVEQALIATKDLSVLQKMPFILLRDRNNQLAQDLTLIFDSYHFEPITGFKSENGDLNAHMCLKGMGAHLAPMAASRRKLSALPSYDPNIHKIYPIHTPGLSGSAFISFTKGKRLNAAEKSFIACAKEYFSELNRQEA